MLLFQLELDSADNPRRVAAGRKRMPLPLKLIAGQLKGVGGERESRAWISVNEVSYYEQDAVKSVFPD